MYKRTFFIVLFFMALSLQSCNWVRGIFDLPPVPKPETTQTQNPNDINLKDAYWKSEEEARGYDDRSSDLEILSQAEVVSTPPAVQPNSPSGTNYATTGLNRYHLIVGSFREPANAQKMMRRLSDNGYQPFQFNFRNGYVAVSAGSYNNKADADVAKSRLRENPAYYDSWVYDINTGLHRETGR